MGERMRRTVLLAFSGVAAFAVTLWLAVAQPLLLVSFLAALILVIYSYYFPRTKLVGAMASIALVTIVVFPVHLVPTNLRYAELGMLAVFTGLTVLYRGVRKLLGLAPILFIAYLVITLVATNVAEIKDAGTQFLMHAVTGIAFLVMGVSANLAERRTIIRTVIVVGAGEALYALYEFVAKPTVLWASPVPEKWAWLYTRLENEILTGGLRSQGTFGHPLLMSFVLIVALGLALRYEFKTRGMRLGLVVLYMAGAVAAGSRSAAIIMTVLALFTYGMSKYAFVRGIFLSAAGLIVAVTGSFMASDVVQRFTESGSLSHRQGALDAVPRLLSEQTEFQVLFGNGWYSTQYVYDRGLLQLDGFVAIDNQFVALLVTTGVVGVVIFAALLGLCFKFANRDIRPALLGAAAVFLVFDVLEFPGTWGIMTIIMGLTTMGVVVKMDPASREVTRKKQQLPDWAARHPELVNRSAQK